MAKFSKSDVRDLVSLVGGKDNVAAVTHCVTRMRFVLKGIRGNKANLITRNTKNDFWTDLADLIFIKSGHNIRKAKRLLKQ